MSQARIRLMTGTDVPFGMHLKQQAGWNQLQEDWNRFLRLQPDGCFVAELDGRPVGTVATFIFGPIAWIAMMLVEEKHRGRGIGRSLMNHAIDSLDQRLIRSIRLDATPMGQPLYESLGFRPAFGLGRYGGKPNASTGDWDQVTFEEKLSEELLDLDRRVTQTDRRNLLMELSQHRLPRVVRQQSKIVGYMLTRPGANATQIGPIIGDQFSGSILLNRAFRETQTDPVFVDIPDSNRVAIQIALKNGLSLLRPLCRMHRGDPLVEQLDSFWASSGPEKG